MSTWKKKGNEKHQIKAVYQVIQAQENQGPGLPCFHRPCPWPLPIHSCHKMISYKQGIIFQIIKILLKVKLLWLSIQAHVLDQESDTWEVVGVKVYGGMQLKKIKMKMSHQPVQLSQTRLKFDFFFSSKGKVETFFNRTVCPQLRNAQKTRSDFLLANFSG